MKLTTKNLKELINEVMNEVRLEPDYSNFASDDQITKIRSLLDSGDPESINMAKTLLDALGADPSYFDDYMQNQEVGEVEKLANKHIALGHDHVVDSLGDYFTELDKFGDREQSRGRSQQDVGKEFHARYKGVEDTYEPRDINEENLDEGFFSKIFGGEDDEPERSPERQKELEDRLAKMKRGEKIVKPKTADQKASDMLTGTDKMQDELSGFDSMSDDEKFNYIMKNKILTPSMKSFFKKLPSNQKIQYLKKNGKTSEYMEEGLMYEGDDSILEQFRGATLEEGDLVCEACLFEQLQEASCGCPDLMGEAEYQGKKVTLNKPTRGDVKKFKVYVKDPSTGNVKKVNFGHGGSSAKAKGEKTMKIRKNNPKARKSFRARHNCDNPGPKTKARYWSCKKW
jgi:hypothetical protein